MADLSYIDFDGEKLTIADPNASKKISVLEEEVEKLKRTVPQHTHNAATTSENGFMSAADKKKLDGIDTGANNYTLPIATDSALGGVKIGYAKNGKNYPVQLSEQKMYVNVPWVSAEATQSTAGLMSADDKKNVDTYKSTLGSVTGKTDSLEVSNSNILATSKAVNTLNKNLVSNVYVGTDGKLRVTKGGADTVLNFSRKPLEIYAVNTIYGACGMVLKSDGSTINSQGTVFSGEYFSVSCAYPIYTFKALKDCKISYVATQGSGIANDATINKIVETQEIAVGSTITMPYQGMMVLNVYN